MGGISSCGEISRRCARPSADASLESYPRRFLWSVICCEGVRLASSTGFSQLFPFVALTRFWGVCFRSQRLRLARLMGEFSDGFLTVVAATAMLDQLRSTWLQQWVSSCNSPARREEALRDPAGEHPQKSALDHRREACRQAIERLKELYAELEQQLTRALTALAKQYEEEMEQQAERVGILQEQVQRLEAAVKDLQPQLGRTEALAEDLQAVS